jgi:sporulation protein YlmC with PRC-barrel domain
MTTIRVTNQTELLAALKTASAGDTVLLADGNYGDLKLGNDYTGTVTIKSENPLGAQFGTLELSGATNIALDGLQFATWLKIVSFSKEISVLNSDVNGTLYTKDVNGLTIDNVDVSGGQFGIILNSVQNFSVTNSHIHEAVEDLMRITGDSYNGLIEGNIIADTTGGYPLHPDLIQFFGVNGVNPRDITIRGNLLYDHTVEGQTFAQGIFLSDPRGGGYENILIEENLIRTNSTNTIYINGGEENVVVRNNTLMPGDGDGGAFIRLVGKSGYDNSGTTVEGNIAKILLDETKGSIIGDNLIYGRNADLSQIFSGTDYSKWESWLPVEGSIADFGSNYGAQETLLAYLKESTIFRTTIHETVTQETAPVEAPAPVEAQADIIYENDLVTLSRKAKDFITVDHSAAMETDEGTISLTFRADTLDLWSRWGLVSKDADGLGDAVSAWLYRDTLFVRFEDGERRVEFTKSGIVVGQSYDLQISFDEENVSAWLDGELVGQAAMDVDLSQNSEDLLIGAFNGGSTSGTTDAARHFYDGEISGFAFHDKAMTPAELAALDDQATLEGQTAPVEAPAPVEAQASVIYHNDLVNLSGKKGDFVTVDHSAAMETDEGTISLTFKADTLDLWRRWGLVSKDADGLGDAVSAWLYRDTLFVRFEDGERRVEFTKSGIVVGQSYDLQISFDEENVSAWLDGELVGQAAMDVDLSQNSEDLLIGAFNGGSTSGTTDAARHFYDGEISGFAFHDKAMTPAELAALDDQTHLQSLTALAEGQTSNLQFL